MWHTGLASMWLSTSALQLSWTLTFDTALCGNKIRKKSRHAYSMLVLLPHASTRPKSRWLRTSTAIYHLFIQGNMHNLSPPQAPLRQIVHSLFGNFGFLLPDDSPESTVLFTVNGVSAVVGPLCALWDENLQVRQCYDGVLKKCCLSWFVRFCKLVLCNMHARFWLIVHTNSNNAIRPLWSLSCQQLCGRSL